MQQFTVELEENQISIKPSYVESSCTNIYDFDVQLTNKDEGFWLQSNSCYVFKLNHEHYMTSRNDNTCMEIFMKIPNNYTAYIVQKTLIDMDYNDIPGVTVVNTLWKDVIVLNIVFKIRRWINDCTEHNIHTYPLFYIDEEDIESNHKPYIIGFSASSKGANGLDVCMSIPYVMRPLEILDIPCKFFFYTSTLDYQNLFLMRSKFARLGIFCYFDMEIKVLRIINPTENVVDLGNKFFQLVLPSPLCFRLKDLLVDNSILFVRHCAPENFALHFSNKDRKSKF